MRGSRGGARHRCAGAQRVRRQHPGAAAVRDIGLPRRDPSRCASPWGSRRRGRGTDGVRVLPRTAAGWTIAIFGVMALLSGVVGLVSPDTTLGGLGFETLAPGERAAGDHTRVFMA